MKCPRSFYKHCCEAVCSLRRPVISSGVAGEQSLPLSQAEAAAARLEATPAGRRPTPRTWNIRQAESAPPAPQAKDPSPDPSRPAPASHHLLLCNRPRSRVRPAISSSCFLISRKSEKSLLADKMGTPGAVRATGTTDGLAAIFRSQPLQPISSDDTSRAPAPKKVPCYWCALAPGQPIRALTSHNVTERPGKRRPLHRRLAKSYWGGKIRSRTGGGEATVSGSGCEE